MGKLGKIVSIIALVIIIVIVGLSLFVRFYLTDERVKALVVPPTEEALGRKVDIGSIDVGLFRGITINDFAIKEQDGSTDFISSKAFVLRYSLLPLLQKNIKITELRIEKPTITIHRDANGKFNYESLAFLAGKEKAGEKKTAPSGAEKAALPLALTVDHIVVSQASFSLDDALHELPTVKAAADLKVSVNMGKDLASLAYRGNLELDGTAIYGEARPQLSGKIDFDEKNLTLALQLLADGQKLNADGTIADYLGSPKIKLDLTSKELNLDKLLALAAALPKTPEKGSGVESATKTAGKAKKQKKSIAASLPPGLEASGKIAVDKAVYQEVDINSLLLRYNLVKGILQINELGAAAMGGSLTSSMEIDLNQPELAYKGNLDLSSIQADQLSNFFAKKESDMVSGTLQNSVKFAGSGMKWETIKKTLTADGKFALSDGRIKETPITATVSTLLGIPQLKNISFKDVSGNFRIEGGKVELKSSLNSTDVQAETAGRVGLDGSLDLPLTIKLSPALGSKLGGQAKVTQYLKDSEGNTVLNMKLTGTVSKPTPTLDMGSVQKQVGETIKNKLLEKLAPTERNTSEGTTEESGGDSTQQPVNRLLKGILGK
jgi:AsmA protein